MGDQLLNDLLTILVRRSVNGLAESPLIKPVDTYVTSLSDIMILQMNERLTLTIPEHLKATTMDRSVLDAYKKSVGASNFELLSKSPEFTNMVAEWALVEEEKWNNETRPQIVLKFLNDIQDPPHKPFTEEQVKAFCEYQQTLAEAQKFGFMPELKRGFPARDQYE